VASSGAARFHSSRPWPGSTSPVCQAERKVFGTIRSVRRVFALVWETSRLFTLVVFATTFFSALIPATQIWIAGALIDQVYAAVMAGGGDLFERRVIILAVLQLAVFLASNVLRSASALSQVLLGERLRYHIQQMIMRHADTLTSPISRIRCTTTRCSWPSARPPAAR
jgi:hypothetical protein